MTYRVDWLEPPRYQGAEWTRLAGTKTVEGDWRMAMQGRDRAWQRGDWERVVGTLPGIVLAEGEEIWTCRLYTRDGTGDWQRHPTALEILAVKPE